MNPAPADERAEFVAFVQARQHRLLRSAYLVCGDFHLAEDLMQGALVKLALRWQQVRTGDPEAYLRTMLYRDAVSWWRRSRRERLTSTPPALAGPDNTADTPTRLVFAAALGRLTPRQRAVLVLRFLEDQSEARTAEILGVSVGTIKSQTNVALRRLRQLAPELRDLLGAARRHVAAQFLVESLLLATGGGAAGVAIGTLATYAVALRRGWQPLIPPAAAGVGLGAAILVGAIAGLYPAMRAARLSPNRGPARCVTAAAGGQAGRGARPDPLLSGRPPRRAAVGSARIRLPRTVRDRRTRC